MQKKIYLKTFGCQMNVRDSEVIAGMLSKAGCALCDSPDDADVIIFNTCSVRQHAEEKVWSEIGRIAKGCRKEPGARPKPLIGLAGCMAQNYKESVFERSPWVDFSVGPADIAKIPAIVESLLKSAGTMFERKVYEVEGELRPEEIYHTGFYAEKDHAFVVISEGCENFCSYCIVPYVRGALRHRKPEDILAEINAAVKSGIRSVTLLGQNVNSYVSSGVGFIDLLGKVNAVEGLEEFSFVTSHPRDSSPELFQAMAKMEKLKKFLHLPVQSGSDRVLKLMNRGYTREDYLKLAGQYRAMVPGGVLTTDVIVGFPTESEKDFEDTLALVKEVDFDSAFLFKYSPRPHSDAFNWPDDVPQEVKEKRHALLLDMQKEISRKKRMKNDE